MKKVQIVGYINTKNSTCFGQFLYPSSGVQHCIHSNRYMSYRFADCLLAGSGWNWSAIYFDGYIARRQLFFSAYFAISYCCVGFIQFFFGVSISICFLLLFVCSFVRSFICLFWHWRVWHSEERAPWSRSQAVSKPVWHIPLLCLQC